ncbi:hypothetical protein GCM10009827_081950 [Dactylosporangium maewongense]|uniref:Uncharacterized protein n=1 Tax=Dactylosporangium maewongense TaxID=634393 RepID=A0ABN2BXV8_9ACTN
MEQETITWLGKVSFVDRPTKTSASRGAATPRRVARIPVVRHNRGIARGAFGDPAGRDVRGPRDGDGRRHGSRRCHRRRTAGPRPYAFPVRGQGDALAYGDLLLVGNGQRTDRRMHAVAYGQHR